MNNQIKITIPDGYQVISPNERLTRGDLTIKPIKFFNKLSNSLYDWTETTRAGQYPLKDLPYIRKNKSLINELK